MYIPLLAVHSWIRWLLVLTPLLLLIRSIPAFKASAPYTAFDRQLAAVFFWALNIQFVLGVLLYIFFSPYTHAAFSDLSAAFKDPVLRFFLVEHPLAVFLALGAGHSNLAKAKKAVEDKQKHRHIMIGAGAALFFILISIPWPFLPYGRMLFFN